MKVPVHVRDLDEAYGLFLGHAEHDELESVVDLFRRGQGASELLTHDVHAGADASYDPGTYVLFGTQFSSDRQEKNLVFEIILANPKDV